jgi:hypothetical protein
VNTTLVKLDCGTGDSRGVDKFGARNLQSSPGRRGLRVNVCLGKEDWRFKYGMVHTRR